MHCRDMTFGQLKSSYFEECDGVRNSKLWIVEIWRLYSWKARTLRNAMVYITINCGFVEIWRLDNWKAHTLRNLMVYITLNFGLLRYDVWTIEKLVLWGMWWCTYITLNCGLLRYDVWTIEKLVLWGMWRCT